MIDALIIGCMFLWIISHVVITCMRRVVLLKLKNMEINGLSDELKALRNQNTILYFTVGDYIFSRIIDSYIAEGGLNFVLGNKFVGIFILTKKLRTYSSIALILFLVAIISAVLFGMSMT